jgi:hypothetical protein
MAVWHHAATHRAASSLPSSSPRFLGHVWGYRSQLEAARWAVHPCWTNFNTGSAEAKRGIYLTPRCPGLGEVVRQCRLARVYLVAALPLVAFVTYEKVSPFHHHPLDSNSSSQCTGYLCPLVKHHVEGDPSQQQGRKSKSDFARS